MGRSTGRLIDPPPESFDKLPTPLTDGERKVIRLFHQKLPAEWEIYVQPHLNGLRPDIVLLHPRVGVAVFEIKDWDLRAMRYYAKNGRDGRPMLMACDKRGKHFSREADNPINKILLYKEELFNLYCPRLDDQAGLAVITAGLVFPCSPSADVAGLFEPFRTGVMRDHPQYFPIVGAEELSSGHVEALFPESARTTSHFMNDDIADDLRGWLKEPFFSQEQRQPLELDQRQRELATTRTDTGYRRIKGPAGCGKSVVLAARASSLAAAGKHTLVASFNITLLNYLRDLAVRHDAVRQVIRRQIDFLNFHHWCKRICHASGHADDCQELWRTSADGDDSDSESVLSERLARLVEQIYREHEGSAVMPKYDAILVDEGQDFQPSWWRTLRLALKPRGEMVLVADKTQNIYGTAAKWTEDAMADAGFRGRWFELKISYRLPPAVIPLVRRFAEAFMTQEEVDIPEPKQLHIEFSPVELRWVHVREQANLLEACDLELQRMMKRLRPDTALTDITFLSGKKMGRGLVQMLEDDDKRLNVLHTFDDDPSRSRRQKRAFFQGDARIKATTVHSFKGWEARHLIVCVKSIEYPEDKTLLYTALTRLRDHEHGSCLTVVSCCHELRMYARSWPDYIEF